MLIPPEVMRRDPGRRATGADGSVVAALGVPLPERVAQPRRIELAVRATAQGISREPGARQAIGLEA